MVCPINSILDLSQLLDLKRKERRRRRGDWNICKSMD